MKLRYASYLSISHPLGGEYAEEQTCCEIVAQHLGEAWRRAERLAPLEAGAEFYLCSTVAPAMAFGRGAPPAFLGRIAQHTGAKPGMVSAYECAGWGFVLRYLGSVSAGRPVRLMIVDADTHNFGYWHSGRLWGKSGFGIATLELDGCEAPDGLATGAVGGNILMEFARAVRAEASRSPGWTLSLPFFPEPQFQALRKILGAAPMMDNRHREFGHCFGSDPWIGLLKRREAGADEDGGVLCASLARSGYFCAGKFVFAEDFVDGGVHNA